MASSSGAALPLPDLVEESFDEAAFLWRRWESELASLTRNLDEVWSWTEDRLQGAIDGVHAGGDAAIELATTALGGEDLDRKVLAAAMLTSGSDDAAIRTFTDYLSQAEGQTLQALVRGLELLGANKALRASAAVLAAGGPEAVGALCRLKAFKRAPIGPEARAALASDAPSTKAEALRSLFYPAAGQFEDAIEAGIASLDAAVRLAATETGVSRGMPSAQAALVRFARTSDASAGPYLKLIALTGAEHDIVFSALRVPEQRKAAIWALGHIGTPRAVESCLAGMRHQELGRACGEAYAWITGVDLVRDKLAAPDPADEAPALEDDDLDANLVPTADELWPVPDADAVARDWEARKAAFLPDVRYAQGRPVSIDQLMSLVETGPMLRRTDLVFELRARTRGAYDVETRAFTARQRQMMAAARAAAAASGRR